MSTEPRPWCRVCERKSSKHSRVSNPSEAGDLVTYFSLGRMPLVNWYSPDVRAPAHPLSVQFCPRCALSSTTNVVDKHILFDNYAYHSSISHTFIDHTRNLADRIADRLGRPDKAIAIDIGSNDGVMVESLLKQGFSAVGVEPALNQVVHALKHGRPTVHGFWDRGVSYDVGGANLRGRPGGPYPQVITALNVLAHVDDLHEFLFCVWACLDDEGIFIFEVPYAFDMIANCEFDTIYHEHLSYFLMKPLLSALEHNSLSPFRIDRVPIHGGSIRVWCEKLRRGVSPCHEALYLVREEARAGLHSVEVYQRFEQRATRICDEIAGTFEVEWKNLHVVAFGAAAKGTVLVNSCGLDEGDIAYVIDDTPEKQGSFLPGTKIPIVSREVLNNDRPDRIVILAWNFADEIVRSLPSELRSCAVLPYRNRLSGLPAIAVGDPEENRLRQVDRVRPEREVAGT